MNIKKSFEGLHKRKQHMQNIRFLQIFYCIFILLVVVLADLGLMSWFREYASQYPGIDKVLHFILVGFLSWILIFAFNAKRLNLLGLSLWAGSSPVCTQRMTWLPQGKVLTMGRAFGVTLDCRLCRRAWPCPICFGEGIQSRSAFPMRLVSLRPPKNGWILLLL